MPYIAWAIQGCAFRAVAFSMAYVMLARGDGRRFVVVESLDALIGLGLNILCYNLLGIAGLGVAYVIWYAGYMLLVGSVYRGIYKMHLRRGTLRVVAACVASGGITFAAGEFASPILSIVIAAALTLPFLRALLRIMRRR